MIQRKPIDQRYLSIPDVVIVLLIATVIYGVVAIGQEWRSEFQPVVQIDLSVWQLPYYTLLSGIRGAVAYLISLFFTLTVGYAAAKSKSAEKIIIPMLDILQSVPVLGFLPGLLLALVALFPNTNTGLELAAIIMIFTGQVWNMTFSYYASLKSIPSDLREASTMMGLNWREKLLKVELPFSAVNLAWNSLLSMAGGWFFLIPCEAMTLGDKQYRLPGIGSYMDLAVRTGNYQAIALAVVAMIFLIVSMDFFIWRPILAWVQKFRLEQIVGAASTEPLMQIWLRESQIVRWILSTYRNHMVRQNAKAGPPTVNEFVEGVIRVKAPKFYRIMIWVARREVLKELTRWCGRALLVAACGFIFYFAFQLLTVLWKIPPMTWFQLVKHTLWTMARVLGSLILSTLWAVPVGIWIGTSPKRVRIAQPLIQVLASFPAPMLYPLALTLFFTLGISFHISSMFLMLLGVQWYVLFNVLAGALRIPQELSYALSLMETSRWDRWKVLYLPSVFPSLATGWVSAAGGAWNASVVAEYIAYQGSILKTEGLGADLNVATAGGDFTLFAASLTLMVFVVILLNRVLWSRVHHLAQTRFRMDA